MFQEAHDYSTLASLAHFADYRHPFIRQAFVATCRRVGLPKDLCGIDPDQWPGDGNLQGQAGRAVPRRKQHSSAVTPAQVQVAWVKQTDANPVLAFPEATLKLKGELALITQILKSRYPNIRLSYCSSRIYAGYASVNANPEPYAYETGFAVKWLIEEQISSAN